MIKQNIYIVVGIIFILAFLAGNFVYPQILKIPFIPERDFKLGLDLQGGAHLIYQADLSQIEEREREVSMEGLRDVIERRVDLFGVREPLVQIQGERLIIELAGIIDPAQAIEQIGQTPFLEFKEQRTEEETQRILDKRTEVEGFLGKSIEEIVPEDFQKIQEIPEWNLIFENPNFVSTPLTGKYLENAEIQFDQTTFQPTVAIQFNDEGSRIFGELTEKNVGRILAIYIDQVPISTPVVQEKISGGRAQITGDFTVEEAQRLVRNLNAGALPVPITLISQQTVGPTLGRISLEQSLMAGIFGFLAIILFLIIFYRLPGILAGLSLLIYVILVLTFFKLIPVTLTLAGIAGFILSMGMAVDANVLIFSRMREELKSGKSYSSSLEDGIKRAWPAIRDGNLTTILIGLILFGFGTSFIKGFAFTLVIGNLIGMFTAIFITNYFLKCFIGTRFEKIKSLWR